MLLRIAKPIFLYTNLYIYIYDENKVSVKHNKRGRESDMRKKMDDTMTAGIRIRRREKKKNWDDLKTLTLLLKEHFLRGL